MSNPLGIIVDKNNDPNKPDTWALVIGTLCVNTVISSYNDILRVQNSYDYLVDYTVGGQNANTGDTYNPGTDTFSSPPPPPIDWVENLVGEFNGAVNCLQTCLVYIQSGNLTPIQINAAYNSMLNDNPGLDQATLTILTQIYNYVLAGE